MLRTVHLESLWRINYTYMTGYIFSCVRENMKMEMGMARWPRQMGKRMDRGFRDVCRVVEFSCHPLLPARKVFWNPALWSRLPGRIPMLCVLIFQLPAFDRLCVATLASVMSSSHRTYDHVANCSVISHSHCFVESRKECLVIHPGPKQKDHVEIKKGSCQTTDRLLASP